MQSIQNLTFIKKDSTRITINGSVIESGQRKLPKTKILYSDGVFKSERTQEQHDISHFVGKFLLEVGKKHIPHQTKELQKKYKLYNSTVAKFDFIGECLPGLIDLCTRGERTLKHECYCAGESDSIPQGEYWRLLKSSIQLHEYPQKYAEKLCNEFITIFNVDFDKENNVSILTQDLFEDVISSGAPYFADLTRNTQSYQFTQLYTLIRNQVSNEEMIFLIYWYYYSKNGCIPKTYYDNSSELQRFTDFCTQRGLPLYTDGYNDIIQVYQKQSEDIIQHALSKLTKSKKVIDTLFSICYYSQSKAVITVFYQQLTNADTDESTFLCNSISNFLQCYKSITIQEYILLYTQTSQWLTNIIMLEPHYSDNEYLYFPANGEKESVLDHIFNCYTSSINVFHSDDDVFAIKYYTLKHTYNLSNQEIIAKTRTLHKEFNDIVGSTFKRLQLLYQRKRIISQAAIDGERKKEIINSINTYINVLSKRVEPYKSNKQIKTILSQLERSWGVCILPIK